VSVACGRYAATFTLDDPDALVDAALSCPLCLGADSTADVDLTGDEVTGRCSCAACGATWSLSLEPQQLLRLVLDPPRDTPVRFGRRLPPLLASDLDDDEDDGRHG
jgi:hypothetical protein